jgi:hypothetical protein
MTVFLQVQHFARRVDISRIFLPEHLAYLKEPR